MTSIPNEHAELVVLGGGPGGYPAAFAAADRHKNVVLVSEEPRLGGVCLLRGCIPSKALLHVSRFLWEAHEASQWGVWFGDPNIDLDQLRRWSTQIVDGLAQGIAALCQKRNVKVIEARGRFLDSKTLELSCLDGTIKNLTFDHAILATGSLPLIPPQFDLHDRRIVDSTSALEMREIPKSILIIGGGYIGLEMGTVYAALGTRVTLVELTSTLLPSADHDLVRPLQKQLEKRFEAIHLSTSIERLDVTKEGIGAKIKPQSTSSSNHGSGTETFEQTFDQVLVAVGRKPNLQNLGLENTVVKLDDHGFVQVDRQQRTSDPTILAIGDVVGEPMLAHKATRQAKVAVEVLAGEPASFDNRAIPAVVFTDPEIAWCGLTETKAKSFGQKIKIGRFSWKASGRASILGRNEGFTKMVFDSETERILGMGIVGAGAGELIAEGVLAIEMGAVARDVAESIHAHPTLSETVMESAEDFLGTATHAFRQR